MCQLIQLSPGSTSFLSATIFVLSIVTPFFFVVQALTGIISLERVFEGFEYEQRGRFGRAAGFKLVDLAVFLPLSILGCFSFWNRNVAVYFIISVWSAISFSLESQLVSNDRAFGDPVDDFEKRGNLCFDLDLYEDLSEDSKVFHVSSFDVELCKASVNF